MHFIYLLCWDARHRRSHISKEPQICRVLTREKHLIQAWPILTLKRGSFGEILIHWISIISWVCNDEIEFSMFYYYQLVNYNVFSESFPSTWNDGKTLIFAACARSPSSQPASPVCRTGPGQPVLVIWVFGVITRCQVSTKCGQVCATEVGTTLPQHSPYYIYTHEDSLENLW